ncbi:hypothetical protein [Streptomyces sp. NPDC059788]|uniref:hypothetical protein n=1 Tax=Streptomyces sp. NPDC059788 TaxID=3346948 RepID=UPI003654C91C
MTGDQPQVPVREFARFLRGLTRMLDETAGWYGVFTLRDPAGMRACLDGADIPPWDVVESLLHDLAGRRGEHAVRTAAPRARRLHAEAVEAYDARPGAPGHLGDRLDVMLRERQYAALRERELLAALRASDGGPGAERLADELAWARDDHIRSGVRARELQGRIDALADRVAARRFLDGATGPGTGTGGTGMGVSASEAAGAAPSGESSRRPKGARFAGLEDRVGAEGTSADEPAVAPRASPRPAPRGARFAGVAEEEPDGGHATRWGRRNGARAEAGRVTKARTRKRRSGGGAPSPEEAPGAPGALPAARPRTAPAAPRTPTSGTPLPSLAPLAARTSTSAARLARLRAAGRGGEAHALLCAAAHAHPAELPLLIGDLEHAGLVAEVPTLLWEAACLPPGRLAAAADALAAAGRTAESARLLRQGVARPVGEVADTALALLGAGRPVQARELFAALVRARTPEEAVAAAASAPDELTPLLLDAAAGVSPHRHRDITHALRAGGTGG